MNIQMKSGNSIIPLIALIEQHLQEFWFNPMEFIPIVDPSTPDPGPLQLVFTDARLTKVLREEDIISRAILHSRRDGERDYKVYGRLNFPIPIPDAKGDVVFLLGEGLEVVVAVGTESARNEDGTVQIYGAEPMTVLMSVRQLKAQIGQALMNGTAFRGFDVEIRRPDGEWGKQNVQVTLPEDTIASIDYES
jgi:hypothetical protein